jgi:hypothetical protein
MQNAFFTPAEIMRILSDKDAASAFELLRTRMKGVQSDVINMKAFEVSICYLSILTTGYQFP